MRKVIAGLRTIKQKAIKTTQASIGFLVGIISKLFASLLLGAGTMIFGKQYKIQNEISRLVRKGLKNKSKSKDDRIIGILNMIDEYYSAKNYSLEIYLERINYLTYSKNTKNGVFGGIIASAILFLYKVYVDVFAGLFNNTVSSELPNWLNIILVSIMIILVLTLIVLPGMLAIYSLIIYIYRVFYKGYDSMFNIYEIKKITELLKDKYEIGL